MGFPIQGLVINVAQRLKGQHSHHAVLKDAIEEEEPEEEDLIRDDFNLHKIIVVATAAGKVRNVKLHYLYLVPLSLAHF